MKERIRGGLAYNGFESRRARAQIAEQHVTRNKRWCLGACVIGSRFEDSSEELHRNTYTNHQLTCEVQ